MANPDGAQEIEQAFIESWVNIEKFYLGMHFWGTPEWYTLRGFDPADFAHDPRFAESIANQQERRPFFQELLALIADMRRRGYDRKLRAGQSLDRLMLSRSHKHGLRERQAFLGFTIDLKGGMLVSYYDEFDHVTQVEMSPVAFNPELEQLLAKLLERPID